MTGIACKSLENSFNCLSFFFFFFFLLINTYLFACIFLADECRNYQNLTDGTRKYDYVTVNSKCDNKLNGWYRFKGAAGTKMVTTCPRKNRCDTHYPVWLSEDHPTVAEGTVTRKFCIHTDRGCCYSSVNIKVKNCSSYYIYNLVHTRLCSTRY